MNTKTGAVLLLLVAAVLGMSFCGGCTTTRTTTIEERAALNQTLTTIESAIVVAVAAGKLTSGQSQLALAQVAQLRDVVQQSATTPMGWGDLMQRATNLAVQWLGPDQVAVPPATAPPGG